LAPISSTPTNFGKKDNALASSDINKGYNSRNSSAEKTKSAQKTGFWDFDALEDFEDDAKNSDDEIDYNNTNLNKLSQEEVQKHKNKMDVLFNKNQKKPGESGFIYDKQEEFVPTGDNEWDEDEDF
jgi:CRISPR/Cas system CSM-associated protein Csm4 (group 5 of RAMP superfamily)